MKTLLVLMGTVVGRAAALCRRMQCDPRAIYEKHLEEFKALLEKPEVSSMPVKTGASVP